MKLSEIFGCVKIFEVGGDSVDCCWRVWLRRRAVCRSCRRWLFVRSYVEGGRERRRRGDGKRENVGRGGRDVVFEELGSCSEVHLINGGFMWGEKIKFQRNLIFSVD